MNVIKIEGSILLTIECSTSYTNGVVCVASMRELLKLDL